MDSDQHRVQLHTALKAMQQQVRAAHREWITALVALYPDMAEQLWQYHDHYCLRAEYAELLPLMAVVNRQISLLDIMRKYGGNMDECALAKIQPDQQDPPIEDDDTPRKRAARTRRRRTREALVVAATELVKEGGMLRMEDVAAIADVSPATLYTHFKSKGEMLQAAFDRLIGELLAQ